MNIKTISAAVICAALLCGCGGEDIREDTSAEPETEIAETSTDENEYLLVRGTSGSEFLESIFYCGENHPLPLVPEENNGFVFSDGLLIFPDGSCAAAETDGNGNIISLIFERGFAPEDFSVCGIGFDSRPEDIPASVGIADGIYGDKNGTVKYCFFGGGITELTFVYTDRELDSVYIVR